MFINCKHCGTLVATDPVNDQPPERCPRCRGALRSAAPAPAGLSVANLLRPTVADEAAAPSATDPDVDGAQAAAAPLLPAAPHIDTPQPAPVPVPAEIEAQAPPAVDGQSATMPPEPAEPPLPAAAGDADTDPASSPADGAPALPPPAAAPARRDAASSRAASPSFARRVRAAGAATSDRQRRLLVPAIAALSLLLVLQVLLADRARLARDPGWRPLLTTLCGVLRCSLPAWREPAALTLLARDVRPHPQAASQLQVNATFRNDARWAQAWPHLRLTLSDIDGRAVGTRTFAPAEYLGDAAAAPTLAPGQSAEVRLLLREPDGRAVSFAFDFI